MNYLSLDVGTTCCKCQLFSDKGEILEYLSEEYDFKKIEDKSYVDVEEIWTRLKGMIARIAQKWEISSFCVSSLGESFVLLDKEDKILFYPMLYTDPRGEEEAEEISKRFGEKACFLKTGVVPHSMYSLSKLLWIQKHFPDLFARADKLMLVGEYIGYLLTGKRVIDCGLAARTGVLDIESMTFDSSMLQAFDLPTTLFSEVRRAGSVVGEVKREVVDELHVKGNPVLVLGSHDQICATLGAGVLSEGEAVDGMGTVECITVLFKEKPTDCEMGKQGYPCVPYATEGTYCTYILNYSCGSTVNWLRKKIMHKYAGEEKDFFTYIEKGMTEEPTSLLTLPYFGGAATPYQDLGAKGAILNLTTETDDSTLYQSVLEGTALEMRLNAETVDRYGIKLKNLVATGGGANSEKWLRLKSDIQNLPIKVLRSAEGGLCGCAMLQAVALHGAEDLESAKQIFVRYAKEFLPNAQRHGAYQKKYEKYKKLYKTIKEFD